MDLTRTFILARNDFQRPPKMLSCLRELREKGKSIGLHTYSSCLLSDLFPNPEALI